MNFIKTITLLILFLLSYQALPNTKQTNSKDCVILIHGLGRTSSSMSNLASYLRQNNFIVINDSYPSTQKSITDLANEYMSKTINKCLEQKVRHINFVTHSLGGIILQKYLHENSLPEIHNIVMLSPPNHGSPWADLLHNYWLFRQIFGSAITELTTKKEEIVLKPGKYKIGIIAGSYNFNPLSNILLFAEPNDGKVSVSSAKMKQMNDFIILPVNHTFMMRNELVKQQIIVFLKQGKFTQKINGV